MLCDRLTNPARLADRWYIAEPKLDGQRAQLPVCGARAVACYSRRGLRLRARSLGTSDGPGTSRPPFVHGWLLRSEANLSHGPPCSHLSGGVQKLAPHLPGRTSCANEMRAKPTESNYCR